MTRKSFTLKATLILLFLLAITAAVQADEPDEDYPGLDPPPAEAPYIYVDIDLEEILDRLDKLLEAHAHRDTGLTYITYWLIGESDYRRQQLNHLADRVQHLQLWGLALTAFSAALLLVIIITTAWRQ